VANRLVKTATTPEADEVSSADPVGLIRDLEASPRFVRDTGFGRILHPGKGKVSYREAVRENGLHLVVDAHHVSAHIDPVTPLVLDKDGNARFSLRRGMRYSLPRVLAHNLSSLAEAVGRLVRGEWSEHRCELLCESVLVEDDDVDGGPSACHEEPAARTAATPGASGFAADRTGRG
jgi:hypothetical protein